MFNGSTTTGWRDNQSASPTRIKEVPDPAGGSDDVLRFTVENSDIAPLTPTDNPRAQLSTPYVVKPNVPFWESFEVYLPTPFPASNGSWISLGAPFDGAPYDGTPPVELQISHGNFEWFTNGWNPHPWRLLWEMLALTDRWIRFTWHVDPAVNGHAELYVNGTPVRVAAPDGITNPGYALPLIDGSDDKEPWFAGLQVYYEHDAYSSVTAYFRDFMIATGEIAAETGS
ncbi:MAG: heparin lyase I family protein [Solirubrobacteraceae bacterium]